MTQKSEKPNREHLEELREMVRSAKEPAEEVLTIFCQRHGLSMEQCRKYYDQLVAEGEIKEE